MMAVRPLLLALCLLVLAPARAAAPAAAPAASAVVVQAPLVQAAPAALPAPAFAPAPALGASSSAGSLLQTILALLLVLGLLAALAWFLKRYGPRPHGGNAAIKLVGALSLGGRERVLVVEVGEQWIVLGASPGRINALSTMPRQEIADGAERAPASASFADWLKQTIDKRNAN